MTTANATPREKLKELVLYVAQRCENHQLFGRVKLNKILFFSDMNSYLRRGQGVTGAEYIKLQFGPVPKDMDSLVEDMVEHREALEVLRPMPDMTEQRRLIPARKPNLRVFDTEALAIVEEVIEWIRPMTAHELSELTHKAVGWRVAHQGETIPYSAALLPEYPVPLTPSEVDYGLALGQKIAERVSSATAAAVSAG